jgi:hypothetical protein
MTQYQNAFASPDLAGLNIAEVQFLKGFSFQGVKVVRMCLNQACQYLNVQSTIAPESQPFTRFLFVSPSIDSILDGGQPSAYFTNPFDVIFGYNFVDRDPFVANLPAGAISTFSHSFFDYFSLYGDTISDQLETLLGGIPEQTRKVAGSNTYKFGPIDVRIAE